MKFSMYEELKIIFSKGEGPNGYHLPIMALTLPQFRQVEQEVEEMKKNYEDRIKTLEEEIKKLKPSK